MEILQTTLAGATEFDGTANKGLLDFSELDFSSVTLGWKPSIVSLVLDTGDLTKTLPQITVLLVGPATASKRAVLVNAQNQSGIAKLGCRIGVPRDSNGVSWQLQVLTPGKTVTATLTVEYCRDYFGGVDG